MKSQSVSCYGAIFVKCKYQTFYANIINIDQAKPKKNIICSICIVYCYEDSIFNSKYFNIPFI